MCCILPILLHFFTKWLHFPWQEARKQCDYWEMSNPSEFVAVMLACTPMSKYIQSDLCNWPLQNILKVIILCINDTVVSQMGLFCDQCMLPVLISGTKRWPLMIVFVTSLRWFKVGYARSFSVWSNQSWEDL